MIWREATRGDVPAIVALLADDVLGRGRESTDVAPYLGAFDRMQAEGSNHLIVAEDGGRIIACYQLTLISGLSLGGTRRAQIEGLRVAADRRGGGLGAALIADAESRAHAGSCALIQLTSNAARTDALRFYQRAGFTASHVGLKKSL